MTKLVEKYRLDYTPPNFLVEKVTLTFFLDQTDTIVETILHLKKNPDTSESSFILNGGKDLTLISFMINNKEILQDSLTFKDHAL